MGSNDDGKTQTFDLEMIFFRLFPQFTQTHLFIVVFIQNLGRGQIKILLGDMHASFTQGVHARLGTDALELGARTAIHFLSDLGQVDSSCQIHAAAVDAEDVGSCFNPVCLIHCVTISIFFTIVIIHDCWSGYG